MSFASETRLELCKIKPQHDCCQKAECYGLLLFGRNFSKHAVAISTENGAVAHRVAQFTAETIGVIVDITTSVFRRNQCKNAYTVLIKDSEQKKEVVSFFGHSESEISLRINRANIENDCCESAFLRGVFLSCGTVTDPKKDYRIEFVVPYMNLAKDLSGFLREIYNLDLQPGVLKRKGSFVVYIKGSEKTADLLTFIGAGKSAMNLMQTKMFKEVRNNINRKTNFETANIDKTASAAAAQIIAIEKIMNTVGISALPEELQELSVLRYHNPELSLRELGKNISEPLSRSGVNHRLQRIVDIAKEIKI